MLIRADICAYAKDKYQTRPEQPWPQRYPDWLVLRHRANGKWYAVLMNIPRHKAGLKGEGKIDILNLKVDAGLKMLLAGTKGILPAYHMNKEHWLSLVLDGSVADKDIIHLLDKSYSLTR
ncbi:MAG: MmcQ/YjbR family DNA-binding protein [Candidatus Tokpelaia sp.]|nr:MAG: MmcQ/YjbR family DNA-binding protein [Candidatus Tokpelaia sp.]KAA6207494.1 MAG: MmcQ/YjbR family DNA-binding protein [Candidatus Tokpelaia sp.]